MSDELTTLGSHREWNLQHTTGAAAKPRSERALFSNQEMRLGEPLKARNAHDSLTGRRLVFSCVDSLRERVRRYDAGAKSGMIGDLTAFAEAFKDAVGEDGGGSDVVAEAIARIRELLVELPLEHRARVESVLEGIENKKRFPVAGASEGSGPPPRSKVLSRFNRDPDYRAAVVRKVEKEWEQLKRGGMTVSRESYVRDRLKEYGA